MKYYTKPYSDNVKQIIQCLKDERTAQGISIRDLAASLGVYPNSIQQILDTNANPQLDSIVKVGNALGTTFSVSNTRSYDMGADGIIDLLAKARTYKEISTRELAKMTGLTPPEICKILSHKTTPRLNAVLLISKALGVGLELYTETGQQFFFF